MIRFIYFIAFFLSFQAYSFSQDLSLCHQVIGTTGNSATQSGLTHSYTVGEAVIFTLQKTGIDVELTQGFHQPDVCLPVSVEDIETWAGWDIQVYPNPASDYLQIQFSAPEQQLTNYLLLSVYDTQGSTIQSDIRITSDTGSVICAGWPSGMYFLTLQHPDRKGVATVSFVKQ